VLRRDAKVELMKRVPLFEKCSRRELGAIASLADELDLPAGRKLTQEGANGREFIVLVEGVAEVARAGKVIGRLGPGDFAGEISLVTGRPRTATVTTRSASRLLVVNAAAFRRLLKEIPSLQGKVLEAVAARLPAD
jgi:CRP/FNR family transcriptional regulator, cyclic AMP receptor protein